MEETITIQESGVVTPTPATPFWDASSLSGIIIALIGVIAPIVTVVLQVRGNAQSKKDADLHTEQASDNTQDIKELLRENTETLNQLRKEMSANSQATVANARATLKRVYNQLAPYKKITVSDKAMVTELYNAYKSITLPDGHVPNSYCDAAMKDIETWAVVPDGYKYGEK